MDYLFLFHIKNLRILIIYTIDLPVNLQNTLTLINNQIKILNQLYVKFVWIMFHDIIIQEIILVDLVDVLNVFIMDQYKNNII